jgi:hypothetical protein
MKTLVFLLEEPSAREMLKGLLPRLLPEDVAWQPLVFEGKQDLEKRLVKRIQGWQLPGTKFVVLRDQDAEDCAEVKARLAKMCAQTGKPDTLVRIACHEIESWYLGDLAAVENGLELRGLSPHQNKKKYREPDRLSNAAQELSRLTKEKYQKVNGSRAIGPKLKLTGNKSRSFGVFIDGVRRLCH